ncbi:MAG: TonB-dependent receptor [Bacteroidia bacterium]|nr:TonB-dependent receptor [Bacteroidia bacterium]MCZ2278410.1 TonB-dependent receptor [Bacteroidia bacterium]
MKKLILIFLFISHIASAQLITGMVVDSITGRPVANAAVTVENTFTGTWTSHEGNFSLRIPADEVHIKVSHLGYKTNLFKTEKGKLNYKALLAPLAYPADEVVVTSTRAGEKTGMPYSEIDRKDIEKNNFGKELPYLLESTPSVVVTSDAGNGVGYTGVWIRGSDPTRTNVTINGIPVNDAETQLVFWVDLPDLASSADNIQIQRGAGTSTNGAGAFGASINIQTNKRLEKPYTTFHSSYGSFATRKNTLSFGTGLIKGSFALDARLTGITSDGYIDRASSNLKSIFISQAYYGKKTSVRLNIFSGKEITYQSWYGTPESRINNDIKEMQEFIIRNSLDSQDSLNLLTSGRTYNYYTYHKQIDDYKQDNYQLHFTHQFTTQIYATAALHYTKGMGFYEEFKKKQELNNYGLNDSLIQNLFSSVNLIRRKWLNNDFYGATYSLNAELTQHWKLTLGGAWNQYNGRHYDELIWAEYLPVQEIPYRYDYNTALKSDFNSFLKVTWNKGALTLFADLQFRQIEYRLDMKSQNEEYYRAKDVIRFFNPKAGVAYRLNESQEIYTFCSTAGKEPSRKDYTENQENKWPQAEQLMDFEAGYKMNRLKWKGTINLYHMAYHNQLVLNGSINDVGEPVRVNVEKSYRQGVEMAVSLKPSALFQVYSNATLSRNRIKTYTEILADYDDFSNDTLILNNTSLAFSPDFIGAAGVTCLPVEKAELGLDFKFIGKQYLDNSTSELRKLKPYHYFNLRAAYKLNVAGEATLTIGLIIYNLTNRLYESNGYTYSYIYAGNRITENFYYPQAGRHFLVNAGIKF